MRDNAFNGTSPGADQPKGENKEESKPKGFFLPDHGLTPDQLAQIQSGIDSVINDIINNPPAPVPAPEVESKVEANWQEDSEITSEEPDQIATDEDADKFFKELKESIDNKNDDPPKEEIDKLPFVLKPGLEGTMCNMYGGSLSCHLIYKDQDNTPLNFAEDLMKFCAVVTHSIVQSKIATREHMQDLLQTVIDCMPEGKNIAISADCESDRKILEAAKHKPTPPPLDPEFVQAVDDRNKYGPLRFVASQVKRSNYSASAIYNCIARGDIIPEGAIVRSTPNCSRLRIRDAAVDYYMPKAGIRKRTKRKKS